MYPLSSGKLTFAISTRESLNEKAFPFGDIQFIVRTPLSFQTLCWTSCRVSNDGTCFTPMCHNNHRRTFIKEPEIRNWGKLSIVSKRNISFELYGCQTLESWFGELSVPSGSSSSSAKGLPCKFEFDQYVLDRPKFLRILFNISLCSVLSHAALTFSISLSRSDMVSRPPHTPNWLILHSNSCLASCKVSSCLRLI